jgi:hypothetical protein
MRRSLGLEGAGAIGAKTVATLVLLVVEGLAAWGLGVLRPEHLALRGWGTLFVVGCFGVVVGTLIFRFWHLGLPSRQCFRYRSNGGSWEPGEGHFLGSSRRRITVGDNHRGEAFELPPRVQHAAYVVVAILLALACIDSRALDLMGRFQRRLATESSNHCQEDEAQPASAAFDPNEPGCALVRRAFELGYASSLGDCAPKKVERTINPACNGRRRDEPLFHYAWRLLDGFWGKVRTSTGAGWLDKSRRDFHARTSHLGALRGAERQVLASAPHASHHIWTNLPDPGDGAFRATTCADRYRWLAHRPTPPPGDKQASKVFEHVVAQLLFESRYEPAAGYCREYHVHWNAPVDACERLVKAPEAFLDQSSALGDVRAVLDRQRLDRELAALGAGAAPKQALDPAAFVSFSCYVEGNGAARSSAGFTLDGHRFTAETQRVAPSPHDATLFVDRYDAVASLLVQGFHYGRLLSEAGLAEGNVAGVADSFAGRDFLLTRLYELDSLDLYLDPGWLAGRPDLLEVYPYERHLKNFVQTFRRQYRRERGRL